MSNLYIAPVGFVRVEVLEWIEAAAAEWFPFSVERMAPIAMPEGAYDPRRRQYGSVEVMKALLKALPKNAVRLLGATEADLAIPMLSFLFGQAQIEGAVAVISLCRLRQEFYGLPPDPVLLRQRTVKETLHELGHTFGLIHCPESQCVMSLATHIALVGQKSERYCGRCGAHLARLARRLAKQAPNPVIEGELS